MCRKKDFVTEKDFRQFAERVKHSGLSTKQALDKFLKAMMQGPKLKIVKKQTIRSYENGIKKQSDGSEKCMTKAAKALRAEEVHTRDGGICQFIVFQTETRHPIICGKPVVCAWGNLHHVRQRSVGRDDRAANLLLICQHHHIFVEHDEFKKSGARA